jgi:hypothetical protein
VNGEMPIKRTTGSPLYLRAIDTDLRPIIARTHIGTFPSCPRRGAREAGGVVGGMVARKAPFRC